MYTKNNVHYGGDKPHDIIYAPEMVYVNNDLHSIEVPGEEEGARTEWVATTVDCYTRLEYAQIDGDLIALSKLSVADQDDMMMEIVSGESISDTTKSRLYARQIHDGKITYPGDVPSELIDDVVDAYNNHYKFQPPLIPPTPTRYTLTKQYVVDIGLGDTEMYLSTTDGLADGGTVVVHDELENEAVVGYKSKTETSLTGCSVMKSPDVTYPIGSSVNQVE